MNLFNIGVFVVNVIIGIIGYFIKMKMDEVDKNIDKLNNTVNNLEKNLLSNYVTKTDFNSVQTLNTNSHEKIWSDLDITKQRISKLEAKQGV